MACLQEFFDNLDRFRTREHIAYYLVHSHYWLSGRIGQFCRDEWQVPHVFMFHTMGTLKNRAEGSEKESDLRDLYERTREAGFGQEVRRRIMIGTYVLSAGYYDAYYLKAQKVRSLINADFKRAFADVDVLMGPTSPTPAFRLGAKVDDPITMYLNDIYTIGANLAGLPALSAPCGMVGGLPVGLQVIGPHFAEARVLAAAHAYQLESDWHRRVPPAWA